MQQIIDWLCGFFSENGKLPGKTLEEQINIDIFDAGLVDSFGIVELVVRLEGTFNVELKPEDLQDVRFKTIAGIAGIIEEKTGGSKA